MALPERIQRTIDAARKRLPRRGRTDADAVAFGRGRGSSDRITRSERVKEAASRAASGTRRVAETVADAQAQGQGGTIGARRTVEETPAERATRAARVEAPVGATLDPFGGPENPAGPTQLQALAGGIGTPDRGETALSFDDTPDQRTQRNDLATFATIGYDVTDAGVDSGDEAEDRMGMGFDVGVNVWGGEI
jgi:hypothetical protein